MEVNLGNGRKICQAPNNHVALIENGRMVFHCQCDYLMTKSELVDFSKDIDDLRNNIENYMVYRTNPPVSIARRNSGGK